MASTPQVAPGSETQRKSLVRRLFTWAVIAFVVLVVLVVFAVVNNNYSFHQTTRAEFNAQLDHAIGTSTQWIVRQPDIYGNPSLMFMVGDMAAMSGDPRLHQFVEGYLGSKRVRVPGQPVTWYYARLVDPQAPVPRLPAEEAEATVGWEVRWDTYATAPDRMELSQADRSDLFSPTKYYWGRRNHQLLALDIYRSFNGASPELDATLQAVSQGVARDAYWDFRVSDSYPQRSAFLLAAGQPELVKKRWIERILDRQNLDGSWNYCWYGWCRGVFEFSLQDPDPGHTTVQGAWALYMLKYRYAQWIEQHYHS